MTHLLYLLRRWVRVVAGITSCDKSKAVTATAAVHLSTANSIGPIASGRPWVVDQGMPTKV